MAPPRPNPAAIARFRAILGVKPTATSAEITAAYRHCALQHHPDQGGDHAKMAEINNAHDWLRESLVVPAPAAAGPSGFTAAEEAFTAAQRAADAAHARDEETARQSREKAAAEDLAAREAVWGPRYQSHGTKARVAPLSSASGTNYAARPQTLPPPPRLQVKKRSRAEQSVGGAALPPPKRSKSITEGPAAAEKSSTPRSESAGESIIDAVFAQVQWNVTCSNDDLKSQQPEFGAWLEDERAWNWHMCYAEISGFKLMGSEREGEIFLWKFCCATEAISMAVKRS